MRANSSYINSTSTKPWLYLSAVKWLPFPHFSNGFGTLTSAGPIHIAAVEDLPSTQIIEQWGNETNRCTCFRKKWFLPLNLKLSTKVMYLDLSLPLSSELSMSFSVCALWDRCLFLQSTEISELTTQTWISCNVSSKNAAAIEEEEHINCCKAICQNLH